ncbi:MAG: hypothetical protein A3H27_00745 [Acidobacteria bacterium RIFCSPLOWO2_02_FULL_59_13]|nr:MAG: hypothetical protein A3H27_00745 [Acidobacteria bacterium RIFCSPLOWO2_02_FULL_59_13]
MRVAWEFTQKDIAAVRSAVTAYRDHPIVRDRLTRNLAVSKPAVGRDRFWKALTMSLLTTQQPSGPTSAVTRLLASEPFPLTYRRCCASADASAFATKALVAFGGIRRHGVIGKELAKNLDALESGLWSEVLNRIEQLRSPTTKDTERSVADFLHEKILGLGPKQARNLLQALGLTRHEVPLDSRVAKWLRAAGFPVPVTAAALADRDYYCFVLDGFQRLCSAAKEFPCVVDGAVFASFDSGGWRDDLIRF